MKNEHQLTCVFFFSATTFGPLVSVERAENVEKRRISWRVVDPATFYFISKIIFHVRSGTLNLKTWNQWAFSDNLCVGCEKEEETMTHFMTCNSYGNDTHVENWKNIFENNHKKIEKRYRKRENILEEAGLSSDIGSQAPVDC